MSQRIGYLVYSAIAASGYNVWNALRYGFAGELCGVSTGVGEAYFGTIALFVNMLLNEHRKFFAATSTRYGVDYEANRSTHICSVWIKIIAGDARYYFMVV